MARRSRDQSGASAVEFALVAPLLLFIVFGIIDFGVVFAQNLAINNAAREGARFGAVRGNTCEAITDKVVDSSQSIALDGVAEGDVAIAPGCGADGPCTGSAEGDRITVTVTHEAPFLVPLPLPGDWAESVTLTGHGEFRCEYS